MHERFTVYYKSTPFIKVIFKMDVEEQTETKNPEPMEVEAPTKADKKNREKQFLADLEVADAGARELAQVQRYVHQTNFLISLHES